MTDEELLASLEAKLDIIRDRVRGVAEGYSPGLVLFGEGGSGKSWAVETTLRARGRGYKLTNSRVTGRGLFELLRDYPDGVHVLDDCEQLLRDCNAQGVLRSALWGLPGPDGRLHRVVSWHVAGERQEVLFTGGLILVGNAGPDDTPQLRAFRTRVPVVRFSPSNDELAAQMRSLAGRGHRHGPHFLPPEACRLVADELLERSRRLGRNLDLRLYVSACVDYLQWLNGAAESDWLDLLESRIHQRAVVSHEPRPTRARRKQDELAVLERIARLAPQERLAAWKRETGKSQAALYRRLEDWNAIGRVVSGAGPDGTEGLRTS